MRNVLNKHCRGNQHMLSNNYFLKIMLFMRYVEKCCRTGQATDDNMAHAHCMLDTQGYKHTLTICDSNCFSTAKMVARTRHNFTLYVHCLSCIM